MDLKTMPTDQLAVQYRDLRSRLADDQEVNLEAIRKVLTPIETELWTREDVRVLVSVESDHSGFHAVGTKEQIEQEKQKLVDLGYPWRLAVLSSLEYERWVATKPKEAPIATFGANDPDINKTH